jgi:NAD+ kinase
MYALNDIVISKGLSSVVGLNVYIDNILTAKYYADGIIVSTPTGSTGYSLSCGGPIIAPSSEMIIITPIAPHTIYNRSIVVPSESNVEIELTEIKGGNTAFLSIDGEQIKIKEKEKIAVVKSKKSTNLISFEESSFFDNIRMKMG